MPIFGRCNQSWITSKSLVTGRAGLPNRPACEPRAVAWAIGLREQMFGAKQQIRDGGRGD
jgi:hypothetical protein